MDYENEMKRIRGLLAIGGALLFAFIISFFMKYGLSGMDVFLDPSSYVIFAVILLYPLGFVYNWRNVLGIIGSWNGYGSAYARIMAFSLKFGVAIAVGWIPGLFRAYGVYKEYKKYEQI
ncbi:hypothetical protein [Exiguobacterium sp. HVEsp1]|uniref:hypothetical protein n=1 Tax=Exiguobacterium sp. HVEsp1 TaxID=1934003 RepID=UPI000990DC8B|nr:hypothetical protein [Exiguobacterium sp. HVEsp1]